MDAIALPAPRGARRPDERSELAAILVLVQGAILVASTIEAIVFASFAGPPGAGAAVLTGAAAILTLATSRGLRRGNRLARRWTVIAEAGVLVMALIEAAFAVAVGGNGPGLVTFLVRIVVPIVVIVALRRGVAA